MQDETAKPVAPLTDSDVGELRDEIQEKRHRRWAYGKLARGAKWLSIVVLGVVAFADAIDRLLRGVHTWFKH